MGLIILLLYYTAYFTSITWVLKSDFDLTKNEAFVWLIAWLPNMLVMLVSYYAYQYRFNPLKVYGRSQRG